MSYESAPATLLVATHCCVCRRPLVDADSVECGIGPTCRSGMDPDVTPDWEAVADHLSIWVELDKTDELRRVEFERAMNFWDGCGADPTNGQKMANLLTHWIAARPTSPGVGNLIMAFRAMGRTRLADALASRIYKIRVRIDGDELQVKFPYDASLPRHMRAMGARWVKDDKFYRVPLASARRLWTALKATFPGERAFGSKGEFTL